MPGDPFRNPRKSHLRQYLERARENIKRWRHICPEDRHLELLFGLIAAWWTFLLSAPVDLFASNKAFLGLASRGDEAQWGAFMGIVCVLHLSGYYGTVPWLRFVGFAAGSVLWCFLAVSIGSTSPHWHGIPINTGIGVYGCFAFKCFRAMCRLAPFVISDIIGTHRRFQRRQRKK